MIKILFDNVEINNDNFSNIIKSGKIYNNDIFRLGSTMCETYEMMVNKEAITQIPEVVKIYEDDTLVKTLYLTNYSDRDGSVLVLDLEDSMTKFNFKYDASKIMTHTKTVDGKTVNYALLSEILQDICTKAGVTTNINTFYGSDKQISWYDNTFMARDYLSYIAELNAKNLRISSGDVLEFSPINENATSQIPFEDISDYRLGENHTITRVVLGDWQYGNNTGETYYINEDNVYVTSQADVQNIYNAINGFSYYNFETKNCILTGIKLGDIIEFTYDGNTYKTFAQYDNVSYSREDWIGSVKVELIGEKKQETEIVGEADKYRRLKRTIDYESGRIEQVIEEEGDLSSRISQTAKSIALTVNNGSTTSGITITTTKEDGTTATTTGTIQMTGLVSFTNLSTSGQTTINGENITTGTIKSANYVANTSGTSINLTNGVIDTKGFKVSSTGNITSTGGTIGNWVIGAWTISQTHGNYSVTLANYNNDNAGSRILHCTNTSTGTDTFYIHRDGKLYASNAEISGTITSSTITGGTITGSTINAESINITGSTASNKRFKISGGGKRLEIYNGSIYIYNDTTDDLLVWYDKDGVTINDTTYDTKLYATGLEVYKRNASGGSLVRYNYVQTPQIKAGNIDCGSGSCSSSGSTHITFNKTFAGPPNVVATPNTTTNGVIALKVSNITKKGFDITIGGTSFPNAEPFSWIAMY